jgi:hypothetical protein
MVLFASAQQKKKEQMSTTLERKGLFFGLALIFNFT